MMDMTTIRHDWELSDRKRKAPETEKWKWDWEIWDPIIEKLYYREVDPKEVECPVCGHRDLYAHFAVAHIAIRLSLEEGRPVYGGERLWGCHNCETVVRDTGQLPNWVPDEDIIWVNEEAKQREVSRLERKKAAYERFGRYEP